MQYWTQHRRNRCRKTSPARLSEYGGPWPISHFQSKLGLSVPFRMFLRNSMISSGCQHVCVTRARVFPVVRLILLLHAGSLAATAASLTFAGVGFSPGSTVKANVPLSAPEKSLAAQGGNAVPPNAIGTLAIP